MGNVRRRPWKLLLVPLFLCAQLVATAHLVRCLRPGVVHAHWIIAQGLVFALLGLLTGGRTPFVLTSHGGDLFSLRGRVFRTLKRFVLKRATVTTVVSRAGAVTAEGLGVDRGRIVVEPMGVDLARRFVPDEDGTRSSQELLFVGRLVEKKGVPRLLQAMPSVAARHPDVMLTVVGYGPDRQMLEALAAKLGIEARVRFEGAVEQSRLPEYYRRAALFVAPFVEARDGDQEGLGLVTVEALGCGCPVVVTALPAVLDVLDPDQDDAFIAATAEPAVLADKICAILDEPARSSAHALECRKRLLTRFDWSVVAGRYAALLQEARADDTQRPSSDERD